MDMKLKDHIVTYVAGIIFCAQSAFAAPQAPTGMVFIDGSTITVGGFAKDEPNWGKREAFVPPYFIDAEPQSKLDSNICDQRHGRFPTIPELDHALRSKAVKPGRWPEAVEKESELSDPKEAQDLADAEGAGFYQVFLTGDIELTMNLPYDDYRPQEWQGRCVIPASLSRKSLQYRLTQKIPLRGGRGDTWPILVRPYHSSVKPVWLDKGTKVELLFRDGDWAYVHSSSDTFFNVSGTGWVPFHLLQLLDRIPSS